MANKTARNGWSIKLGGAEIIITRTGRISIQPRSDKTTSIVFGYDDDGLPITLTVGDHDPGNPASVGKGSIAMNPSGGGSFVDADNLWQDITIGTASPSPSLSLSPSASVSPSSSASRSVSPSSSVSPSVSSSVSPSSSASLSVSPSASVSPS